MNNYEDEEDDIQLTDIPEAIMKFLGGDKFSEIACVEKPVIDHSVDYLDIHIKENTGNVDHCRVTFSLPSFLSNMQFWKESTTSEGQTVKENLKEVNDVSPEDLPFIFQSVTGLPTFFKRATAPEILLEQLGGREFILSARIHNLEGYSGKDGKGAPWLSMDFDTEGEVNHLVVKLQDDYYSMIFTKRNEDEVTHQMTVTNEKSYHFVPAEKLRDIFKEVTGMNLKIYDESQMILTLLGGKEFENNDRSKKY